MQKLGFDAKFTEFQIQVRLCALHCDELTRIAAVQTAATCPVQSLVYYVGEHSTARLAWQCDVFGQVTVANLRRTSAGLSLSSDCGFATVKNIVGSCDVKFPIRLEKLAYAHAHYSSYEPELFPGLIYRMVEERISLPTAMNCSQKCRNPIVCLRENSYVWAQLLIGVSAFVTALVRPRLFC